MFGAGTSGARNGEFGVSPLINAIPDVVAVVPNAEQRLQPAIEVIAFADIYGHESSLYVANLGRGITTPLNTGSGFDINPIWSPDGENILYDGRTSTGGKMYVVPADGSADAELLLPSDLDLVGQTPASWSSQGTIAFLGIGSDENATFDIWVLEEGQEPAPFVVSDANETFATFSPDGKWLLYASDKSGIPRFMSDPTPGPILRRRYPRLAACS